MLVLQEFLRLHAEPNATAYVTQPELAIGPRKSSSTEPQLRMVRDECLVK